MAARGLSTRSLAARSHVDHSTIYRLATGAREPTLTVALALMKVLVPEPLTYRVALETQLGEASQAQAFHSVGLTESPGTHPDPPS